MDYINKSKHIDYQLQSKPFYSIRQGEARDEERIGRINENPDLPNSTDKFRGLIPRTITQRRVQGHLKRRSQFKEDNSKEEIICFRVIKEIKA